jgi:hypothetical protein
LNLNKGYNLLQLTLSDAALANNAWLAGFSEADANFFIRVSQIKHKSRVAFRYSIDQRMADPVTSESFREFLLDIASLFETGLHTVIRRYGTYFRIEITSKNSLSRVMAYFDEFPLYGKKSLDFLA